MSYFHRCGDRSPEGWRHLRSIHVCTTLSLRARSDKLWLQPFTTLQPTHGNHWEGDPATPGHCPDSALGGSSFWRSCLGRGHKWQDWKNVGFWPVRDRKSQRPSRWSACLLSLCWVEPRQRGFEIQPLWCHPHDQVTTSVLCWRYGQLSNPSPCTAPPLFPTQVISPLALASLELYAQLPPLFKKS